MRSVMRPMVALALLFTALPATAHAYLDPATGTFVLQMLIAGVASAFFFLRNNILRAYRALTGQPAAQAEDGDDKVDREAQQGEQ